MIRLKGKEHLCIISTRCDLHQTTPIRSTRCLSWTRANDVARELSDSGAGRTAAEGRHPHRVNGASIPPPAMIRLVPPPPLGTYSALAGRVCRLHCEASAAASPPSVPHALCMRPRLFGAVAHFSALAFQTPHAFLGPLSSHFLKKGQSEIKQGQRDVGGVSAGRSWWRALVGGVQSLRSRPCVRTMGSQ